MTIYDNLRLTLPGSRISELDASIETAYEKVSTHYGKYWVYLDPNRKITLVREETHKRAWMQQQPGYFLVGVYDRNVLKTDLVDDIMFAFFSLSRF